MRISDWSSDVCSSDLVAGPFQHRPRRLPQLDAHLVRGDMGQRGFPQARRAEQQDMIQRLVAIAGRLDEDFKLLAHAMLADVFLEFARTQGTLDGFFVRRCALRRDDALGGGKAGQGIGMYGHGCDADYIYSAYRTLPCGPRVLTL